MVVFWLSLRSNWTNPTSLSLQAFPVSGEANPNVHHGNIRVTNQDLPMHQANQEHCESADVGHVDAAQKRSSEIEIACCSSSGFSEYCSLLCTNNTNTHASSGATPAFLGTFVNPVDECGTEADQTLFKLLTGRRPGRQRHG